MLLGLPPEDLDMFRRLSLDLISIPTDIVAGLNAATELHGYFLNQVEQRRRKATDDIIGDLVTAEIDGEKLTDEAIIAFLRLLLPAGLETTYRSSGNLLYLLFDSPRATRDGQPGPVADPERDRRGIAGGDSADHGHADHHQGSRNRWQDNPGRCPDRPMHGLGQPRRKPVARLE